MTTERVRARVFGEVADEYDRIRPDYPAQLVTDVLDFAALDGRPALEVGAGTGKATAAFAAHGVRITALEPDPAMLALLHARAPGVDTVLASFEEYSPADTFGLLYSAQAWHWTDPQRRWPLAARALDPGGTLALFWNGESPDDPAAGATLVDIHRRLGTGIDIHTGPPSQDDPVVDEPWQELLTRPEFTDCTRHFYRWEREMSAVDFVALCCTTSAYRMLAEPARDELCATLVAELPARLTLAMGTVLYLARTAG